MGITDEAGTEGELTERRIREIRAGVRKAPKLEGVAIPAWLEDLEDLRDFFDQMAPVWDQFSKRRLGLDGSSPFYAAVAAQVPATSRRITVLDIGCGTGIEFGPIWSRAPGAVITGVDVSPRMLEQARAKYEDRGRRLSLVQASYVDAPLGEGVYDYAVSVLTVHHLPPRTKAQVYAKVRAALKSGGLYIEGDHSASPRTEAEAVKWCNLYVSRLPSGDRGAWNFNMPLSLETQRRLLKEAGFAEVKLAWERRDPDGNGNVVLTARV